MQQTGLSSEESVLYWLRISNPERYYAGGGTGRLEIMDESKNDTPLLQPRSDCDPDESPLPLGHDTIDLDASIRKVSALSKAEVATK